MFDKAIPLHLVVDPSKFDITKIDARINTKFDKEVADFEIGGSYISLHQISVPQNCFNEIIEKLKDQNSIFVINGKMTSAGEDFSKVHSSKALKFFF